MEIASDFKLPQKTRDKWQNTATFLTDMLEAKSVFFTRIGKNCASQEILTSAGRDNLECKIDEILNLLAVCCKETVRKKDVIEINDNRNIEAYQNNFQLDINFVSFLGIPLFYPQKLQEVFGTICVVDNAPRNFSPKEKNLLKELKISLENQLENIILNDRLERQIKVAQASLDSLSTHIAVIDKKGIIKHTNKAWDDFARANDLTPEQAGDGVNYLKIIEAAQNQGVENAGKALAGIKSVITGEKEKFTLEYPCHSPEKKRWFKMRVTPFQGKEPYAAVVAHENITARKKLEEEMNLRKFSVDNAAIGILQVTPAGKFEYVNGRVCEMLNYSRKELLDKKVSDIDAEHSAEERKHYWKKLKKNKSIVIERRHQTKDGEEFPVQITSKYLKYNDKEYEYAFVQDITERKSKVRKLQQYRERMNDIFENISDLVWSMTWPELEVMFVSKPLQELIGYNKEQFSASGFLTRISHPDDQHVHKEAMQELKEKGRTEREFRVICKNGEIKWIHDENYFVYDGEGNPEKIRGIMRDITERKEKEKELKYKTFHDELTGLYNRKFLAEEVKRFDTDKHLPISIIMVDINGLKIINNTYGHEKGDRILKKAAEILERIIREKDLLVRYGGDEFVILMPRTSNETAHDIYEKIEQKSQETSEDEFPVTMGLGIATKTESEEKLKDILKQADENMLQHKLVDDKSSKNRLVQGLLNTLGAKSDETKEHAMRMTQLAHRLGERMGITNSELNRLSLLATLHDIGKTNIPEEVLTKPGDLTEEEWQMIQEHPKRGYKIASASEEFAVIAEEVLSHHERWDGKGYPRGLKGENIPYLARIISIVDAFDVMTNGRPYKEPMSREEALAEIEDCAGSQFDPRLAREFVEMVKNK